MVIPLPVKLSLVHHQRMLDHVQQPVNEEACGMLAGRIEPDGSLTVESVIPITNRLHSPVRFLMEPVEQLAAFTRMETEGLELVGIYHSHPNGPAVPSATDLAEFAYPGVAYLIWSRVGQEWQVRAFDIVRSQFIERQLNWQSPSNPDQ